MTDSTLFFQTLCNEEADLLETLAAIRLVKKQFKSASLQNASESPAIVSTNLVKIAWKRDFDFDKAIVAALNKLKKGTLREVVNEIKIQNPEFEGYQMLDQVRSSLSQLYAKKNIERRLGKNSKGYSYQMITDPQ